MVIILIQVTMGKNNNSEISKNIKVSKDGNLSISSKALLEVKKIQSQISSFAKIPVRKTN